MAVLILVGKSVAFFLNYTWFAIDYEIQYKWFGLGCLDGDENIVEELINHQDDSLFVDLDSVRVS